MRASAPRIAEAIACILAGALLGATPLIADALRGWLK